jgi:hypothetical protein
MGFLMGKGVFEPAPATLQRSTLSLTGLQKTLRFRPESSFRILHPSLPPANT